MTVIHIITNRMEMTPDAVVEVDDPVGALMDRFKTWPAGARIYAGAPANVCGASDITPDGSPERLAVLEAQAEFTVLTVPGDPGTLAAIGAFIVDNFIIIAATAAVTAGALILMTQNPSIAGVNQRPGSANNKLGNRTNEAAVPGSRIPDIYGTQRSYPKIWSLLKKYVNHREVEQLYGDIGRGSYDFDTVDSVAQIKDGDTLMADIDGAKVAVYAPDTSPNSGTAQIEIGGTISETLYAARRMNEVNGQDLDAPNQYQIAGVQLEYEYIDSTTGTVKQTGTATYDMTEYFEAGDLVDIIDGVVNSIDVSGSGYTVDAVTANLLTLDNPNSINTDWNGDLASDPDQKAQINGSIVRKISSADVGPYVVDLSDNGRVSINFVARSGLYKTDGTSQERVDVDVRVTLQPIDAAGADDGAAETFEDTVLGSTTTTDPRALTLVCDPTFAQSCKVTVRRLTDTDHDYSGTVLDKVKLDSAFVLTPVTQTDFGDITTIFAEVAATPQATAQKERKLNAVVTRKLPSRTSGSTFTTALTATTNAADIISAICLDTYIGRLAASEVDFDSLYDTVAAVQDYFQVTTQTLTVLTGDINAADDEVTQTAHGITAGTPCTVSGGDGLTATTLVYYLGAIDVDTLTLHLTREAAIAGTGLVDITGATAFNIAVLSTDPVAFCHTFDSDQVSFEETLQAIANAVYCEPYRNATGQVSLFFEQPTTDSAMIFNHRNVLPGSQVHLTTFGNVDEHDGVELRYRDPADDTEATYYIPANQTAVQPKVLTVTGVRNFNQAYWHAWRAWNKIRYGNESVSFDALPLADVLPRLERILVADITRLERWDGHVVAQSGATIEISQPFTPTGGHTYTCFLQHSDGTTESFSVTAGVDDYHVVLGGPPSAALVTGQTKVMRAGYVITDDASDAPLAYRLTSRTPSGAMNWSLTASVYKSEFYTNDGDTPA